jgi:hypothetical protein
MSPRPPIVPTIAPARAITLPASFAACGVLVVALFVALVAAGSSSPLTDDDPERSQCRSLLLQCDGIVEVAVPDENFIKAGADDVTQASSDRDQRPVLVLGQGLVGLRFRSSACRRAHIDSAHISSRRRAG